MRIRHAAVPALLGFLACAAPAFADSVAVTSGPDGTTIVNGKPCRVVTRHGDEGRDTQAGNSTSITAGGGKVSGNTTVSPGAGGASVSVGSGSSSGGAHNSAAAGSDCVIYRDK